MILIDSNVLIDVLQADPVWRGWSIEKLGSLGRSHPLAINAVVLAEVAPQIGPLEAFYTVLATMGIAVEAISDEGAFAAGRAFLAYRRGQRVAKTILPDFLIGGHAAVLGAAILTRDPRFYRSYFPQVELISPEAENA